MHAMIVEDINRHPLKQNTRKQVSGRMDGRHTGANGLLCARGDPIPEREVGLGDRRYQMGFARRLKSMNGNSTFHYEVAQGGGGTEEG